MKFRLSSLILAVATLSLIIGWCVNWHQRQIEQITGSWVNSDSNGYMPANFMVEFELKENGTFLQSQTGHNRVLSIGGTYILQAGGGVRFQVDSIKSERMKNVAGFAVDPVLTSANEVYSCRYAVDGSGCLLIVAEGNDALKTDLVLGVFRKKLLE